MKRIVGYTLAVVLGGGFWSWVAAATASGIVRAWWRHLVDVYGDPPRHMIHAETRPQPSDPSDAARITAGAEYPIRIVDSADDRVRRSIANVHAPTQEDV